MLTPSTEDVRLRSPLLGQQFPASDTELDTRLRTMLEDDAAVIASLTGRAIGPVGTPGVEVPPHLVGTAIRVFALRAERHGLRWTAEARTKSIGSEKLRSISAGPWSESYFGPGEASSLKKLDPDASIHDLLWALCTPEKQDYWLRLWGMGQNPPYAKARQFAHGARQRIRRGY